MARPKTKDQVIAELRAQVKDLTRDLEHVGRTNSVLCEQRDKTNDEARTLRADNRTLTGKVETLERDLRDREKQSFGNSVVAGMLEKKLDLFINAAVAKVTAG
jgi:peptidoglycan hydrolase CwlO-like protein